MHLDVTLNRSPLKSLRPEGGVIRISDADRQLILACDGIGCWGNGLEAGKFALRKALDEFTPLKLNFEVTLQRWKQIMAESIMAANPTNDIWTPTINFALFYFEENGKAHFVADGTYGLVRQRTGRKSYLARPLSWVDHFLAEGKLTIKEARSHQFRDVLTMTTKIDGEQEPVKGEVGISLGAMQHGDRYRVLHIYQIALERENLTHRLIDRVRRHFRGRPMPYPSFEVALQG